MIDVILFFIFLSVAVWLVYIRFRKKKEIDITVEPTTELNIGTTETAKIAELTKPIETKSLWKKVTNSYLVVAIMLIVTIVSIAYLLYG